MPRSVLVEYLKTLFAFHLGLYFLRTMKLLPALVRRRGADPICAPAHCPVAPSQMHAHGCCPYRIHVLADLGNDPDSPMAVLAGHSADVHYRRIPGYVQSHYLIRKLDEFADYLSRKMGKAAVPAEGYFGVGDLLQLLEPTHAGERDSYFKMRLAGLIEDTGGTVGNEVDPEVRRVSEMGLSDLDLFIEVLMALRGAYHRRYITEFLDSVLKRGSGFMHQPKGGRAALHPEQSSAGDPAPDCGVGDIGDRVRDARAADRRAAHLSARAATASTWTGCRPATGSRPRASTTSRHCDATRRTSRDGCARDRVLS